VVVVLAITWLLGFIFLEETHPENHRRPDAGVKDLFTLMSTFRNRAWRRLRSNYALIEDRGDVDDSEETTFASRSPAPGHEIELESLDESREEIRLNEDESLGADPKFRHFTYQVLLQILSVSLLAFHKVASDTLIPLFLAHPLSKSGTQRLGRSFFRFSGGFGMDTSGVGNVLLIIAVASIIARFGPLQTYRWTLSIFPFMYFLTPFVVKIHPPLSVLALLLDLWIKVVLVALGYVCSTIL